MRTTRNDLAPTTRTTVIAALAPALATAIDLALAAKQAHWNVRGRQFAPLHALFDQVAGEAGAWADDLAERIVQLGGVADGTLAAVAARTALAPYPAAATAGDDHVAAIADRLAGFGAQTRAAIATTGEAGDAVTSDLFTELTAGADKQLWMVEAHLS
ncbi:MAG: DNA starvation/stationary phase protection protein Dps [Myxococcales bacterium]|nr:DNA starvation/stationary phase protection protein Dps [Myxococcales bacterium]